MTALLLLVSLFGHADAKPIPAPMVHAHRKQRSQLDLWRIYITSVTKVIPKWEADEKVERFEHDQIVTVKADLLRCDADTNFDVFVHDANTLRNDFNALIVFDDMLEKDMVI